MWNSPTPGLWPNGAVTPGEGGVDISTPIGTPVYALANGPVIASGYWRDNAHGVVTQRVSVPGAGQQDLYYQHIQIAPGITPGQNLTRGQLIGHIGPFNEIEMGFNAAWGGVWGSNHPGPWVRDPRPWLQAILNGSGSAPPTSATTTTAAQAPGANPLDPMSIFTAWWTSAAAPRLVIWGEYIAVFLLAVVLIIIGFVLLGGQQAINTARKAVAV